MSFTCYWCEKQFPGEPTFTFDWPDGKGEDVPLCRDCGGPNPPSVEEIQEKMERDPLLNAIERANRKANE